MVSRSPSRRPQITLSGVLRPDVTVALNIRFPVDGVRASGQSSGQPGYASSGSVPECDSNVGGLRDPRWLGERQNDYRARVSRQLFIDRPGPGRARKELVRIGANSNGALRSDFGTQRDRYSRPIVAPQLMPGTRPRVNAGTIQSEDLRILRTPDDCSKSRGHALISEALMWASGNRCRITESA